MKEKQLKSVFYALLAALFYALNAPVSKYLLIEIPPTLMAGFLYLGAGIGIGILSIFRKNDVRNSEKLTRDDLPYVVGMVVLDIAAPILLMFGLLYTDASTASLLNNFEIVATTVIALLLFKENVTSRLWIGIICITISSILLSYEGGYGMFFSIGSVLVLAATICWGFENNCTRKISNKDTYEIVFIKGIFSGLGALILGVLTGERFYDLKFMFLAILLGLVAYGFSIFFYIRAQNVIGAAKTSAYYAAAPFIGALLSFIFLKESLTGHFALALIFMIAGSVIVIVDTLVVEHTHMHTHLITHTHDGSTHTHVIHHSHEHEHFVSDEIHRHTHTDIDPHKGDFYYDK